MPQTHPAAPNVPLFSRLWLCAYLLGWVPLSYAVEVSRALPLIDVRGWPASGELLAHGVVAALSAAAGWMLWIGNPAAPTVAAGAMLGPRR